MTGNKKGCIKVNIKVEIPQLKVKWRKQGGLYRGPMWTGVDRNNQKSILTEKTNAKRGVLVPKTTWKWIVFLEKGYIDVGDEMCWRQLCVGGFRHQHPLSFNIIVGHQHRLVNNIYVAGEKWTFLYKSGWTSGDTLNSIQSKQPFS